ncbi:Probable endopeptidase cgR_2070 precursor [Nocardia otitidiscaviarum]|uniref:Probable endopeptidase cgR_2070 n=1 Tax=Nocardia otitidiscaviarum TaxID=1823 RepID=A0A378YA73_9NOCA|nr:Probable endopeptidase cgR_2070 precursor [Nocardia otitidiscaviarum]
METGGDRQRFRFFARHISWRPLVVGALGAAGLAVALLYSAGSAKAEPVAVPGFGVIEIPNEIAGSFGFGPRPAPGASTFDNAPGVLTVPDAGPAAMAPPAPQPAAAPAASRSVTVAGLGTFPVPDGVPPLVGIPGVTDNPAPVAVPDRATTGERAVEAARSKLGTAYRMGGTGPDSFDCSGLVQWSYREAGVDLPRTSQGQLAVGTPVGVDELQPGDLVSFYGGGHSALYAGDGRIIHAATYGVGVTETELGDMPITGARRY